MKLYYAPGACSLSDHIALHEMGASFEREKVDLKTKRTENGDDYTAINAKGYVPALILDSGEVLTENVAILDWIAHQYGPLMPAGVMGHPRLVESLAYISTEIHKSFKPFFSQAGEAEKAKAAETIRQRMEYIATRFQGDFLFGADLSSADCYLFVMCLWAQKNELALPAKLNSFRDRMAKRSAVQTAMTHEGLL